VLVPVSWGRGLMRPQRPLKLRMRSQHPFGGRGCSYRSVGGEGGLMRPQRPLMLRMRHRHPFGGRGCSYRSVGGGGWCAPSVHWCCACALSILLEGRGPPHVWGKESYKRGGFIHSLSQLFCDYSAHPDNSSGVWLVNLWYFSCETQWIFVNFFKTKVHVIIRTHISVWPQLNFNA
jgi:hypothetical protein